MTRRQILRSWPADRVLRDYYLGASGGVAGLEPKSPSGKISPEPAWLLRDCAVGLAIMALPRDAQAALNERWIAWVRKRRVELEMAVFDAKRQVFEVSVSELEMICAELERRKEVQRIHIRRADLKRARSRLHNIRRQKTLAKEELEDRKKELARATDRVAYQNAMSLLCADETDPREHPYSLRARGVLTAGDFIKRRKAG